MSEDTNASGSSEPATRLVDSALDAVAASLSSKKAEVLRSKVHLLRLARDEAVAKETARVAQAQAAKGAFNSGQTLKLCWGMAVTHGEQTADGMISACLDVGVRSNGLVDRFVAADLAHFLKSYATSRSVRGDAADAGSWMRAASRFTSEAEAHAARVSHKIAVRRDEYERAQGTTFERSVKALTNRPVIAYALLLYVGLTSVLGTIKLVAEALKLIGSRSNETTREGRPTGR
jgi:hypothetical protein